MIFFNRKVDCDRTFQVRDLKRHHLWSNRTIIPVNRFCLRFHLFVLSTFLRVLLSFDCPVYAFFQILWLNPKDYLPKKSLFSPFQTHPYLHPHTISVFSSMTLLFFSKGIFILFSISLEFVKSLTAISLLKFETYCSVKLSKVMLFLIPIIRFQLSSLLCIDRRFVTFQ